MEKLRLAQLEMLSILCEIDRICQKYNLHYWLFAGTLLGAVRHMGFIPWDDDCDTQQIQQRGFSGTGRSQNNHKLSPINRKIHTI